MRLFIATITALFGMSLWAQTDIQFQSHLPFQATEVTFSAYIATESFNESSRLNTEALWFVENQRITVQNGLINTTLEGIPDSVFEGNFGKIYVYAYVNGQSLGRLSFHKLPYAYHANVADNAARAQISAYALDAGFASKADTASFATRSTTSSLADTARYAVNSKNSAYSDTAEVARYAQFSLAAQSAELAVNSGRSIWADSAKWSQFALRSGIANSVDTNGVSTVAIQNSAVVSSKIAPNSVLSTHVGTSAIQTRHLSDGSVTLSAISGGNSAPVGAYLTRGQNGLSWDVTPHHRTTSVQVYTASPSSLPNNLRWVVSRVAIDYSLVTITNPVTNQIVTIFNGSTANVIELNATTWSIDTGANLYIFAGQSYTLWYNGTNWIVIGQ